MPIVVVGLGAIVSLAQKQRRLKSHLVGLESVC